MDYKQLTKQYYSMWLGRRWALGRPGIRFIRSRERDKAQYGYSDPFDICVFRDQDKIVVSYGKSAQSGIERLVSGIQPGMSADSICALLGGIYGVNASHSIKYVFTGAQAETGAARVLGETDFDAYAEFFAACSGEPADEWLREYFDDMRMDGTCCGVFDGVRLVSCTDAPGMPYMAVAMREIGINTLPEYRGRGFATQACALAVGQILRGHMCPLWSADAHNIASQRLAEKLGFEKFGDMIMVTL